MRVKLSYTVDAEDVLREAAKLIGLQGEDMQQCVKLFQDLQVELRGDADDEAGIVNIHRALDMIEEYRAALLTIDRRLEEVTEIVQGYDEYLSAGRAQPLEAPVPPEAPSDDDLGAE